MKIKYEVVKYSSLIRGGTDRKVIGSFRSVKAAIELDEKSHFQDAWTIIEVNYQC